MRFWDSSALVSLVLEEPRSRRCRELLRADSAVVVWAFTRVEVVAAVRRRRRERAITDREASEATDRLDRAAARWTEVVELSPVRDRAERLLAVHPLRAADALQLGAALYATRERPRRRAFVTSDDLLAEAAADEGFDVIVPQG